MKLVFVLFLMFFMSGELKAAVCDLKTDVTTGENQNCFPCGTDCSARFDYENHKMTVSGTGYLSTRGWPSSIHNSIKEFEVTNGIDHLWVGSLFSGNQSLEKVKLADTIVDMYSYSFHGTTNLKEIDLPDNLTFIRLGFFTGTSLTDVVIPENVTSFQDTPFAGCRQLQNVYCGASEAAQSACANMLRQAGFNPENVLHSYEKIGDYFVMDGEVYSSLNPKSNVMKKDGYYIVDGKRFSNIDNLISKKEAKYIYTVEEAIEALGKSHKNKFIIKYQ